MTKENLFHIISQYTNALYTSNEFDGNSESNNWLTCDIHSFNKTDMLVNVFHPKNGKTIPVDILDTHGFLILKRMEDMIDLHAVDIACAFMDWKEPYVFFEGNDGGRMIVKNSKYENMEFNIGINDMCGKFWYRDVEANENGLIVDHMAGMSKLTELSFGMNWMFDGLNAFASDRKRD